MTAAKQATPHNQLIAELMDSRIPKNEREHAAAREIERLRQATPTHNQNADSKMPTALRRTDMSIEAMKQALEALEFFSDTSNSAMDKAMSEDAITSLRQAIADAEKQEPVAWAIYDKRGGCKSIHWHENHCPDGDANMFDAVPLYPHPLMAEEKNI